MRTRQILTMLVSLMLLLTMTTPLFAGGWVVITLDELPQEVHAGEPLSLGFTIRQHGQRLIDLTDPYPRLIAHNPTTGERLAVEARLEGGTGHYRVEVTFPSAGEWEWQVDPRPFPIPAIFAPLTVLEGVNEAGNEQELQHPLRRLLILAERLWQQIRLNHNMAEQPVPHTNSQQPTDPQRALVQYGHDLFFAKGCVACHRHEAARVVHSSELGPNLSYHDRSDTYLQQWLADPAAMKPKTEMPDPNLTNTEIEALVAFLTSDGNRN